MEETMLTTNNHRGMTWQIVAVTIGKSRIPFGQWIRSFSQHEKVTCRSRCAGLDRVIPSFALTSASIDMILDLNMTGDLVFPVDVAYHFDRREWIDNSNYTAIQLPWTKRHDEVYPLMNDILLIKSWSLPQWLVQTTTTNNNDQHY